MGKNFIRLYLISHHFQKVSKPCLFINNRRGKRIMFPESNISAWANGLRPMSQPVKGLFYYYFEYRKLQSAIKKQ